MVVNFDKDTPEKIVDATKAEKDKIIVIANGCAIRLDPKSVIVRERSRGFDGG